MFLNKLALQIAGKENFQIDPRIGTIYILRQSIRYSLMLLRGWCFSLGYHEINFPIFIGRNVRLYEKRKIHIGSKAKLHEKTKIDALSTEGVYIGENVVIGENSVLECTGSIRSLGKGICIGSRSSFGSNCYFGAAGGINIGEDVIAGQYVRFHSENHVFDDLDIPIREQGVTHQGIQVGNNCWIGAGVVFLDGAVIGDGCVVAANAVISGKFEANCIIGGVPARLIRKRS